MKIQNNDTSRVRNSRENQVKSWRRCLEPKVISRITTFISRFLGFQNSTELILIYRRLVSRKIRYHSASSAVKSMKEYYGFCLRWSAELEIAPLPFHKADSEGFPRILIPFKPYLRSSRIDDRRAVLTILQLYKLFIVETEPPLSSITNPYRGSTQPDWLSEFDQVLEEHFPKSKLDDRIFRFSEEYHISTKNGPNGPALISIPYDREAIRGTRIEQSIIKLCKLYKGDILTQIFEATSERPAFNIYSPTRRLSHSRLRIKYESGGKSRVFAILDWFSQSALIPIHKFLMNWLKTQFQDGTAEHSKAAKACSEWSDGRFGNDLWSFDLTTATDRYPLWLQKRVAVAIFGQEIADCWETIVSQRLFDPPKGRRYVSFMAGQPLGALSSWAIFAVTHHLHIRTAGRICGIESHRDLYYRIIGDDICIARDRAVAQKYISMMEDLNVPFSREKSVLPSQMKSKPVCELAKRLFVNGIEISPLPPDAILELFPYKRQLVELAWDRGYMRAGQIYSVQSILTSQLDYASLTFPVGVRLPLLKDNGEVKFISSIWEDRSNHPPAGISPDWFLWDNVPQEVLSKTVNVFVRKLLEKAIQRAKVDMNDLRSLSRSSKTPPYQGGDWKPEPSAFSPIIYPKICEYVFQELQYACGSTSKVDATESLYNSLAAVHDYISSGPIWYVRDWRSEKQKTRVLYSQLITHVYKETRAYR